MGKIVSMRQAGGGEITEITDWIFFPSVVRVFTSLYLPSCIYLVVFTSYLSSCIYLVVFT